MDNKWRDADSTASQFPWEKDSTISFEVFRRHLNCISDYAHIWAASGSDADSENSYL